MQQLESFSICTASPISMSQRGYLPTYLSHESRFRRGRLWVTRYLGWGWLWIVSYSIILQRRLGMYIEYRVHCSVKHQLPMRDLICSTTRVHLGGKRSMKGSNDSAYLLMGKTLDSGDSSKGRGGERGINWSPRHSNSHRYAQFSCYSTTLNPTVQCHYTVPTYSMRRTASKIYNK